jgi:hypothetical protein
MLYRITTESGALYVVDTDKKVAGRVTGDPAKESKFAADGELRPYSMVKGICVGSQLAIFWTADKIRLTSPVVKVETDEPATMVEE